MIKRFQTYIFQTIVLLFLASCATPVSPTGGPKDETPPEVLVSVPPNGSVLFSGRQIAITFNEFVQLKELNNQMIISPPPNEMPDALLRRKTLHLTFKESLRPNSTYNIFFGNGIVDLTEGNALQNYTFSFSTGAVLDSLSVEGKVMNAFNLSPVKETFVMLFDSIYDSVPYLQRPYYLARTAEDGTFHLRNLRQGKYMLFALGDKNNNYIYDSPTEAIAFYDSLIEPKHLSSGPLSMNTILPNDTLLTTDTLDLTVTDSTFSVLDSIMVPPEKPFYTLHQFTEADSVQRLLKPSLLRQNVVSFAFRYPVKNVELKPLNPGFSEQWQFTGYNNLRDTITLWIPEAGADTLSVEVRDNDMVLDTLHIALKPAVRARTGRQATVVIEQNFSFKNSLSSLKIKPTRPLLLTFKDPIASIDTSKLILLRDTVVVFPQIRFIDSLHTQLSISYPWKEEHKYRLTVNDSTFVDIFGKGNDSTALVFTPYKESETGLIQLKVTLPANNIPYLIQLLGDKQVVIEQRTIKNDTTLVFNYLLPKVYSFKVIYDRNRNGRWDSGNYLRKIQPEKVAYFNKTFEVRANWTMEEEWEIGKEDK